MSIQNLQTYGKFLFEDCRWDEHIYILIRWTSVSFCRVVLFVDPWADACKGADEVTKQDQPVHIRIQQRNGRKTLTTVQGIVDDYDKKKLVKVFKKVC